MDFLNDTIFAEFGRPDLIGGIDNEALDFEQLEQFIHVASVAGSPSTDGGGGGGGGVTPVQQISVTSAPSALTITSSGPKANQSHLPESPPDSGSEPPYSPGDLQALGQSNIGSTVQQNQQSQRSQSDLSTTLTDLSQASIDLHHGHLSLLNNHHQHQIQQHQQQNLHQQQHHLQQHPNALYIRTDHAGNDQQHNVAVGEISSICKHENMLLSAGTVTAGPVNHQSEAELMIQQSSGSNLLESYRNDLSQGSLLNLGSGQISSDELSRLMPSDVYAATTTPTTTPNVRSSMTPSINARKRKLSQPDITASSVKPEPSSSLSPICQQHLEPDSPINPNIQNISLPDTNSIIGDSQSSGQNPDTTGSGDVCPLQCIRFSPFQQQSWHVLCDQALQELPVPHYRVDADKGFNFSNSDDAFVCQKKNHFQITCHAQLQGAAIFVRTSSGIEKIKSFHLHFYGVKLEAPNHTIRVEQSQSDRSKKPFHPVPIDLQNRLVSKVTVGRLHFSETTSNNMRKKGRPNPEQRYFQLIVGLHAHTHTGHFPIVSQGSERIIVRASNPGQFESDVELCWQRGVTQDSIFHAGRVGINTDRPDESLVVHGNLKVSGHIVQPSDSRAKQEIGELDTAEQLKNVQKIRIVKFRYEPEFAIHSGLKGKFDGDEIIDTGVIAQEVREVLPDAVQEAGSIVLSNGEVIENFLLVNKDRILMENIGAVKELCKVTGSLETRIEQLEKINLRLVRIQQLDRSNHKCSTKKCKHLLDDDEDVEEEICSNKTIQMIIIVLVIIMAICLAAISTLYFVEHSKQRDRHFMRYDRYDLSPIISRDSILINSNTNSNHYLPERRQSDYRVKTTLSYTIRPLRHGGQHGGQITEDLQAIYTYQQLNPTAVKGSGKAGGSAGGSIHKSNSGAIRWPAKDDGNYGNSDESSSEKVSETIILPQDVENNSIDGDNQKAKIKPKTLSLQNNTIRSDFDQKIQTQHDHHQHQQQQHQQQHSPQSSINNKSRADAEDQDLQYLSNNSESEDQVLFETGSGSPTVNKAITVAVIGLPTHCKKIKTDSIECQSTCCEESNNLSIPDLDLTDPTANRTTTNENDSFLPNISHTALPTSDPAIAVSTVMQQQQKPVVKAPLISDDQPLEVLRDSVPSTIDSDGKTPKRIANVVVSSDPNASAVRNASKAPILRDCYPIVFLIRSETFNVSLGSETICLNGGQNQNITYTIPISKYMKETKLELHFVGSNTLQWTLCSTKERTSRDFTANNVDDNKVLQRNPNKSVFYINLPNYGYFERQIELQAGFEMIKNTCQDQADDTNNLLQYNIRIFRDCD